MQLKILIKNKKVRVCLLEKNRQIDFCEILEERSLSEKLLPEIDRLLKRNGLSAKDISGIETDSDENENFTTTRLAVSLANAWNGKF